MTLVNGFVGMEGSGPVGGGAVTMDMIIAGVDPVATDATACRVMGFDPRAISHIRRAYERGLGEIDAVEVVGDGIEAVRRVFERP